MRLVQKVLTKLRRHGPGGVARLIFFRVLKTLFSVRVLRAVRLESPREEFLACPPPYTAGFLSGRTLRRFAANPETEMSQPFVAEARSAGDECYALCEGFDLAAFSWYSTRPTLIGAEALTLYFSREYVYMYKALTVLGYRGQRLHEIGVTCALRHYRSKGYRGLVSYIEATNLDSLKSSYRMGYEPFGTIFLVRLFGRTFALATPGCKALDLRIDSRNDRALPRAVQAGVLAPQR